MQACTEPLWLVACTKKAPEHFESSGAFWEGNKKVCDLRMTVPLMDCCDLLGFTSNVVVKVVGGLPHQLIHGFL